ncbi:MAG TPA: PH domain-containing protein [Candidatus Bathyarchaeia archaeon]
MTSNNKLLSSTDVVWAGKPWIVPAAVLRTFAVFVVAILFFWLELFSGVASDGIVGLPIWFWTFLVFGLIWLISVFELLIFRLSNSYVVRQDGLEIKRGIIRLHSFVVTPSGFGDMLVNQSLGGRIFGYGDIIVNSQGEREIRLRLVHHPFKVSDMMRNIMGKPIVRIEGST